MLVMNDTLPECCRISSGRMQECVACDIHAQVTRQSESRQRQHSEWRPGQHSEGHEGQISTVLMSFGADENI